MRLTIDKLLILAPRLRTYLSTPNPVWRDIVDAADWLRGEMGISPRCGARLAWRWAGNVLPSLSL